MAACGILMGSARPKTACWVNFVSFYNIGLPVALILGFKLNMEFVGLFIGLVAAQVSGFGLMVATFVLTDWVDQAKRAKELTRETEGDKNEQGINLMT
jgi:MATE family multidrug resistance protein